jgi:hypothetical protein
MDEVLRRLEANYASTGDPQIFMRIIGHIRRLDELNRLVTDYDSEMEVLPLIIENEGIYSEGLLRHRADQPVRETPPSARSRLPRHRQMLRDNEFSCWRVCLDPGFQRLVDRFMPSSFSLKRRGNPCFECVIWTTDVGLAEEAIMWMLEKLNARNGFVEAVPYNCQKKKATDMYHQGLHEDAITSVTGIVEERERRGPPRSRFGGYGISPGDPRREWYRDNPYRRNSDEKLRRLERIYHESGLEADLESLIHEHRRACGELECFETGFHSDDREVPDAIAYTLQCKRCDKELRRKVFEVEEDEYGEEWYIVDDNDRLVSPHPPDWCEPYFDGLF